MRNNSKHRRGFTILELIIYIVIFGIIGTLGAAVFSFATKSKIYIGELTEVQLNETQALSRIVNQVHAATKINSAGAALSLAMSSSTNNPTVFSLSNGAILMQQGSGAAAAITPSSIIISNLSFTSITNPSPSTTSVQISITAGYNNNGVIDSNTTYSLRTTAVPL